MKYWNRNWLEWASEKKNSWIIATFFCNLVITFYHAHCAHFPSTIHYSFICCKAASKVSSTFSPHLSIATSFPIRKYNLNTFSIILYENIMCNCVCTNCKFLWDSQFVNSIDRRIGHCIGNLTVIFSIIQFRGVFLFFFISLTLSLFLSWQPICLNKYMHADYIRTSLYKDINRITYSAIILYLFWQINRSK